MCLAAASSVRFDPLLDKILNESISRVGFNGLEVRYLLWAFQDNCKGSRVRLSVGPNFFVIYILFVLWKDNCSILHTLIKAFKTRNSAVSTSYLYIQTRENGMFLLHMIISHVLHR